MTYPGYIDRQRDAWEDTEDELREYSAQLLEEAYSVFLNNNWQCPICKIAIRPMYEPSVEYHVRNCKRLLELCINDIADGWVME